MNAKLAVYQMATKSNQSATKLFTVLDVLWRNFVNGNTPGDLAVESHELTEAQTPGIARAAETANQMVAIQADYNENRDLVNQMLGQIQMSRAISKFTDVVSLSKLKQIKESKMYRAAAGQKMVGLAGEEIADVGTWAGFCQALGVSAWNHKNGQRAVSTRHMKSVVGARFHT